MPKHILLLYKFINKKKNHFLMIIKVRVKDLSFYLIYFGNYTTMSELAKYKSIILSLNLWVIFSCENDYISAWTWHMHWWILQIIFSSLNRYLFYFIITKKRLWITECKMHDFWLMVSFSTEKNIYFRKCVKIRSLYFFILISWAFNLTFM